MKTTSAHKKIVRLLFLIAVAAAPQESKASLRCESLFSSKIGAASSFSTEFQGKNGLSQETILNEVNFLVSHNPDRLLTWASTPFPGQAQSFEQLEVVPTSSKSTPFELRRNGRTLFKFTSVLGAGKRGTVYLTDDGRAVKILKQLDQPRELALQAWAATAWKDLGVRVPEIYELDPAGNYLVQEFIPGRTVLSQVLEAAPAETVNKLTPQVLEIHNAAERVEDRTGLFFDIKAANFVIDAEGSLVFVDCGPRLDKKKHQYYRDPQNERLSNYLFLEAFFFRQARRETLSSSQLQQDRLLEGKSPIERLATIIEHGENSLPEGSHLAEAFSWSFKKEKIRELQKLSTELWNPIDISVARELLKSMRKDRTPNEAQLLELKSLHGRLKRLRSSFIALSEQHQAPKQFDQLVTKLGKLRDAWKRNDRKGANEITLDLIDLFSSKNIQRIELEIADFKIDSSNGFDRWLRNVRRHLLWASQTELMTAKELHEVRKDISELLAIAELRYALQPNIKSFNQLALL